MKTRKLKSKNVLPNEEISKLGGKLLDESYYDFLVGDEDINVLKPDGTPLILYRRNVLTVAACKAAYPALRGAARITDNRGYAAGEVSNDLGAVGLVSVGKSRVRRIKRDGTLSNTYETMSSKIRYIKRSKEMSADESLIERTQAIHSGIIGFYNRESRFPYCRLTAFNLNSPQKFAAAMLFIREVNRVFQKEMPQRYEAQMEMIRKTSPDFYIHGTAFSTITVNRNWQTALHKDKGDLKEGFGVMSALRAGKFSGCHLVFPKYRVAVNMQTRDVCLADVHEWHGNTPIIGIRGAYDRVSCVFYYRSRMIDCGSAEEELERVKTRKKGPLK